MVMRLRRELCVCRRPPRHTPHLTMADETPTAPTARATGAITIKPPRAAVGQHSPQRSLFCWRGAPLSPGLCPSSPAVSSASRHSNNTLPTHSRVTQRTCVKSEIKKNQAVLSFARYTSSIRDALNQSWAFHLSRIYIFINVFVLIFDT